MRKGTPHPRQKRISPARSAVPAFPLFCDFSCPHAGFAPTQAVGACRREQAVFCTLFRSLNNKHSLCLERKRRTPESK